METRILAFGLFFGLVGCAAAPAEPGEGVEVEPELATSTAALSANDPAIGFTANFRAFLAANATYASYDFARSDLSGASAYGGRVNAGDAVVRQPVVFVHGNSDRGLGGSYGGWDASLTYFRAQGYGPQEVYAFTWGDANPVLTATQYHSRENLTRIRTFLQAVLAYTGASKIDVVAHSMGVTLARKAILGGGASDMLDGGSYDLGSSLGARVDAFLGISGANLGLTSCWVTGPGTPTCGSTNGFYPGTRYGWGPVYGRSAFLDDLLPRRGEGSYVASMWSGSDEVLGPGALVWGSNTARVPGQTTEVQLGSSCSHFESKTATAAAQYQVVAAHRPDLAPTACP